jgi:ATP-dependent DNA helicase PIF1
MLNEIRIGLVTPKTRQMLESCKNNNNTTRNGILPTVLYAKNLQVDTLNTQQLNILKGEMYTFRAADSFVSFGVTGNGALILVSSHYHAESSDWPKLLEGCLALKDIQLKVDAQVMLLRNISDSLVNGCRGVVTSFQEIQEDIINVMTNSKSLNKAWFTSNHYLPVVRFSNGETQTIAPEAFMAEVPREGIGTNRC